MTFSERFWPTFLTIFFRDVSRPVEWISLLSLAGWSEFLLGSPQTLLRDSYSAFAVMPAWLWSMLMAIVVLIQIAAMLPISKGRETMRFAAMALASGLWTIVAISFWNGDVITTGARTYSAIALITALTGTWLGWNRQQSPS